MKTSLFWGGFVPHIRVELMIFCVRGRCPGPLDECGRFLEIGCKSTNIFETGKIFFQKTSHLTVFKQDIFIERMEMSSKYGRNGVKNNVFWGAQRPFCSRCAITT